MNLENFQTKVMVAYQSQLNKLHNVGATYLNNNAGNEHAQDNLYKVYHGYKIFSDLLMFSLVLIGGFLTIHTNHIGWLVLMTLGVILPISFKWSMKNVLNIYPIDYNEWLEHRKSAKKNKKS